MISSMEDVANMAGVSISTVSRVINNSTHSVSDATRKKVEKAIKKLNYQPNIAAQNLKQSHTNVIAFLARNLSDAYYGELARGITDAAIHQGVLSFICNTGYNIEDELRYHNLFHYHRIRGLILGGGGIASEEYLALMKQELSWYKTRGLRMVSLAPQGLAMDTVMIDNVQTSKMVTQYLLDRGHRSILYVGGPEDVYTVKERVQGFKEALLEHHISLNPALVLHTNHSWEGAYDLMMDAWKKGCSFTAVYCETDRIAISVIKAIRDKGMRVPEDISIVSIGGTPDNQYSSLVLTTALVPLYDMGVKAVQAILSDESDHNCIETYLFSAKIQEGNSVRDIRR